MCEREQPPFLALPHHGALARQKTGPDTCHVIRRDTADRGLGSGQFSVANRVGQQAVFSRSRKLRRSRWLKILGGRSARDKQSQQQYRPDPSRQRMDHP